MSRKPKSHIPGLSEMLVSYCETLRLDFHQYSPYHMRIMDGGYTVLDIWTTGRYYILTTDYLDMVGRGTERGGEKGKIPILELEKWLTELFFPESS